MTHVVLGPNKGGSHTADYICESHISDSYSVMQHHVITFLFIKSYLFGNYF